MRGAGCHDRGLPSREPVLVKTRLAVALLIALSAPAVALAAPPTAVAPASVATESPADAAFRALYEKEWKWRQQGGAEGECGGTEDAVRVAGVNGHVCLRGVTAQAGGLIGRLGPARCYEKPIKVIIKINTMDIKSVDLNLLPVLDALLRHQGLVTN